MKKLALLTISLVLLAGCQDFLDIRPEGSVPSSGTDYTKAENIFKPVSAAYASMRGAHEFAYTGIFEITSDDADKGSSPEDNPTMKQIDDFTFDASNSLINEVWSRNYDIVSSSNFAIDEMPKFIVAQSNDENKKYARQCQAESRYIRAYAYFNLVRVFGRVPMIDTIMTSEQLSKVPQSSSEELYDFIESDLTDAVNNLPESYAKGWDGRITKFTAMALKARVHMFQNEWDSVASLTDRIIASNRFSLLPDFREVFSMDGENGKESLFEIQSSTLGKTTGEAPYVQYAYQQGPRGNTPSNMQGWGFCTPSNKLIQFYADRGETIRPATTFLYRGTLTPEGDSIKASCSNPVYNGKVYTPSVYNKWSFNGYGFDYNPRIIRYADILLMFAEAKANGASTGNTSGYSASTALDEVRSRAGLSPTAPSIENIWDERRAEFAMEDIRFFDLVRTGQASTALASKGYVAGKNNLFPIPSQQMQLNTALTQNPMY